MRFLQSLAKTLTDHITSAIDAERLRQEEIVANIADPFAKEIEWSPLVRGGAGFSTHTLVFNPLGNLEFVGSKSLKLFSGIFIGMGLLFDIIVFMSMVSTGVIEPSSIALLLIPSVFVIAGFFMYRNFSRPLVFDKQSGYFYKGKPKMAFGLIDPNDKNTFPLSSIYAIQVIREQVRTKNSSYPSYEINLVLDDKRRVNVVDHGYFDGIKKDSAELGAYLRVPIWGL